VALSLPSSGVTRSALASTTIYATAVAISLIIGLWAALVVARRVNRPMADLREAANALGRGDVPPSPNTDIREIRDVGEAIAAAAAQRRAIEAEREDLLRREHEARTEAEAANRAKDQFLAMLGHELRNPLAALSNAASLLGDDRVDPQAQRRSREVIQRQVAHLARLTDDLLDAARALLGKIQLRLEPVDLARVAAQAINMLAATRRSVNHRIVEDLKEAWVHGDPVRLDQIVANLLINAVKYTPAGGTITVRTRRDGNDAVLTVGDTGVGLSPDLAARAFDLFVQGDRDLDRAQGGLGIGLTLVRRLAELHGGAASVKSEGVNRGSEFTVRLPAVEAPAQPADANVPATARARSVLIVEDNDDAREMLQALLQVMGHRVETARDGVEGLDKALAIAPDVAFVDLGLPAMDGFELARRLRAAGDRHTLLVALTGYGAREDRDRALAAGFDAHATKPIDAAQLAALLAQRKLGTDPNFLGHQATKEN
jgi:signal transduction histidine kinase/ActR/RegA family two-component response regulator